MQDIEFTIQEDVLYILQTRAGKRTATAAVKIAVDMVDECLIDKETPFCGLTLASWITTSPSHVGSQRQV